MERGSECNGLCRLSAYFFPELLQSVQHLGLAFGQIVLLVARTGEVVELRLRTVTRFYLRSPGDDGFAVEGRNVFVALRT